MSSSERSARARSRPRSAKRGIGFIDFAPVSGAVPRAITGTLSIMAGN